MPFRRIFKPAFLILGVCLAARLQAGLVAANLSLVKTDAPDPVTAGSNLTYTLTVSNKGPATALNASWSDTLPAGTTFVSLSAPAGWTCLTPAVGDSGTVTCDHASFAPGTDVFTLIVEIDAGVANGTVVTNDAEVASESPDPDDGDNFGSTTTTVDAPPPPVDPTLTKTASAPSVTAGDGITYTITYTLPAASPLVTLDDTLPASTTFTSLLAPPGFICTTPAPSATGTVECDAVALAAGSYVFTLNVATSFDTPPGAITNTANSTHRYEGEPRPVSAPANTNVTAASTFTATKTVSGSFTLGGAVTYTGGPLERWARWRRTTIQATSSSTCFPQA